MRDDRFMTDECKSRQENDKFVEEVTSRVNSICILMLANLVLAVLSAAILAFLFFVAPARAAPIPFPKSVKPFGAKEATAWLKQEPLIMTWRNLDFHVQFHGNSDYNAATAFIGDFIVQSDGDGNLRVYINEWIGSRVGNPLHFSFPAKLDKNGRMGGEMRGGGECWLKRIDKK